MAEKWEMIKDADGYIVSDKGNVFSLKTRQLMAKSDNVNGYKYVGLYVNGKRKNFYVHRLVAAAFVENPNGDKYVNHLDFDRANNAAQNLQWCTAKENVRYSAHKMRHRKNVTYSNTGEKYISYSHKRNVFRIVIDGKEYPAAKTLTDAIKKRNEILTA